jgi:tetratricopeptide (TPR) repeat protein/aryl carrier-like protein
LKEAFDAAERSQILYIRKKNEKQEAGLYIACTYLFFQRDYAGKALQATQMASKIYQRIGSPEEQARCQQRLAEVHLERGEFGEAMLAAESARELCESCGDRRFEAVVHMTMSGINYNAEQDNFEAALEPAEKAQSIARELEDTRAEATTLQAIARMQVEQQDYKAALDNARKARVCFQDLGDKRAVCEILITIAQTELISELNEAKENDNKFKGEPGEKGLKLAKEALELSRRLRDGLLTVSALHAVAEVHIAVGKLDEAAKVIDEAMALCQESEYQMEEGRVCNLAAYMHLYAQRKDESTEMANKSLAISTNLEDAEGQAAAQEVLAKIQAAFRKAEVVMMPQEAEGGGDAAPAAADSLAVAEVMEYNGPSLDVLSHKLQSMVRDMFDVEDIENDTMLMDVGIDSLSMLDFHAKVARDFPGVAWSPTMLFDYPTLKELCEFMDEAMQEAFNARLAKSLKGK